MTALPRGVWVLICALTATAPAAAEGDAPYLWRAATGGQIRSRPAVGPEGTIYALAEDSFLYAWRPGGSLRWRHDLGWIPWDCLAVSPDGTVYAGLKNGDFLAVNPHGGRLWTVRLDGLPSGDPAVARDGTVLVGTSAGTLLALSHLGRREWSATLPGPVIHAPVIDGAATVYVVAADRRLYALAPWGQFKWSLPIPGAPGQPVIVRGGAVVLGTAEGDLLAVSPEGTIRWKMAAVEKLGSAVVGLASAGGTIVAATADGHLAAFSLDGRRRWQVSVGRALETAPVLAGAGSFVARRDGSLQPFDPSAGTLGVPRTAAVGGVTAANAAILIGGRDWILYALSGGPGGAGSEPGASASDWPQEGHDPGHTDRTSASPQVDNEKLLSQDPDYLYLQGLLSLSGREGIQLVLSDVGRRVSEGTAGRSRWYVARMLEGVVGSGVITQERRNQALVNDFPDLRAAAADLLAVLGSTSSRAALIAVVDAEPDPLALAAEIRALGVIRSDPDGASARAIVRAFRTHTPAPGMPVDNRLAAATVDALGRIATYRGDLGEGGAESAGYRGAESAGYRGAESAGYRGAIDVLLQISQEGYAPSVRAAADSILHGDLKAYILPSEE